MYKISVVFFNNQEISKENDRKSIQYFFPFYIFANYEIVQALGHRSFENMNSTVFSYIEMETI